MKHKIIINLFQTSFTNSSKGKIIMKFLEGDNLEETGNIEREVDMFDYLNMYKLIKKGIKVAIKDESTFLLIESNMKLIINILNNTWKIRAPKYIPIYNEIKELEKQIDKVEYKFKTTKQSIKR